MSQWQQVQQLGAQFLEQVSSLYDDNFPMDIRHSLASWIEGQDWDTALNHETLSVSLINSLVAQMEQVCSLELDLLQRHNLKRILQQFQGKCQASPVHMANVIACCLREEKRILSMATVQQQEGQGEEPTESMEVSERQREMDHKLPAIRASMQEIDQAMKKLQNVQEDFEYRYKMLKSQAPEKLNTELVKRGVEVLQYILNMLDSQRKDILSSIADAVREIETLMTSQLAPELTAWKRQQQLSCLGGPERTGVDRLQCWFTLTVQSLFLIKRQLDRLEQMYLKVTYDGDPVPLSRPQLEDQVKYLISSLIQSCFVVEKQPCMHSFPQRPLVLKIGVYIYAKVRLLLKLPEVDYQLKVQATVDKDSSKCMLNRRLGIENSSKVMDTESSNGCLSVEFQHLVLKDQKGNSGTRNSEGPLTVTEEFHTLSFQAQICLQGLTIDLKACSLPLVIITNNSQIPAAWASVMWYNMLSEEPRNLNFFISPPSASWCQLSEALSWQFAANTDRGLNNEQLLMLKDKLLGPRALRTSDQVSWSKFSKDKVPGKSFSFWEWLDSILEFIKRCLLPLWIDGCIMGFVSREQELSLLKDKQPGTFLLRFSESHLGGVTFTWVEHTQDGKVKLQSVEPYNKSHLNVLPFADVIRDYQLVADGTVPENPLKFLYPDVPRDKAFGKHYNCQQKKGKSYIPLYFIPTSSRQCHAPPAPESTATWMFDFPMSPFSVSDDLLNIWDEPPALQSSSLFYN